MKNPLRKRWHIEAIGTTTGTTYDPSVERFRSYDKADAWLMQNSLPLREYDTNEPIRLTVAKR